MSNTTGTSITFAFLQEIADELSKGEVVFPTFVDVTIRIRELSSDPDLSVQRIARMLSADPLLAARALRLANSAAFNVGGSNVSDLNSAVIRIGLNAVRNLMYSVVMDQLRRSKEMVRYHESARQLWDHTLDTAALACVIAKKCTRISAEKALFAGLVHDIGAFYLLYRLAVSRQDIPEADAIPLVVQWHEEIGYAVLSSMDMPEEITEAMKSHEVERPDMHAIRFLGDVIYLASRFASRDSPWYTSQGIAPAWSEDQPMVEIPGCSMEEIIAESRSEITSIKSAFI